MAQADEKTTNDRHAGVRDMPGGFRVRWDAELAETWRASGHWLQTTLGCMTRDLAARDPDRILVVEGEREHNAADFYAESVRLASALLRRGLKAGDVISYQIPNWYEGSVINCAAALAGLIVNPLVPIYRDNEIVFMLEDVGTKLVFTPERFRNFDYADMYGRVNERLANPVDIVVLRGSAEGATRYEDLLATGSADDNFPPVDPDSIYVMMHTSGTTGRPKCVVHSHNSFLTQGEFHVKEFGTRDDEVILVATPISHIAGIILANLTTVVGGAKVVMMDIWNPAEAVKLCQTHRINALGGATPFVRGILDAAKEAGTHLPDMLRFGCGGAAVPPELMLETHEWFPNALVYRSYGCTEVPTVTGGTLRREDVRYGAYTDGSIKHTEVKIVDAVTGDPVDPATDGEILLRGPNQMLGYLRLEDNEGAFDAEGYFRTGDLGRVVDGQYLLITGRKKDLIIRNGENLSPKEIEDALFTHPGIDNVAVVGMPSAKTGEAVCAFIVAKAGHSFDVAEVSRHLVAFGLAKQKIPECVVTVDSLPVSPQGKVLKNPLREQAKALT